MGKYIQLGAFIFLIFSCSNGITRNFTDYYVNSDENRAFSAEFLTVQSMQNPADLWLFNEIITKVKPDVIIETGTAKGGTSLYFANLLDQLNLDSKVITIDIYPELDKSMAKIQDSALKARAKKLKDKYIEVIKSDSISTSLLKRLEKKTKGKKVLVTLDSCHNFEHVIKELKLYSKLVSIDSYIIVQDTIIDNHKDWVKKYAGCIGYSKLGGPGVALKEFLKTNNNFVVDPIGDKFLLTFHKDGYLRRVK